MTLPNYGPKPEKNGRVFALTTREMDEQEDRALVLEQMNAKDELAHILRTAILHIERLEFPFGWPSKHFDLVTTVSAINDLLPDQKVRDMELACEVRRVEINRERGTGR